MRDCYKRTEMLQITMDGGLNISGSQMVEGKSIEKERREKYEVRTLVKVWN